MLSFVKNVLQRFMFSTLMSHTNAHAVCGRPTLNDVEWVVDPRILAKICAKFILVLKR